MLDSKHSWQHREALVEKNIFTQQNIPGNTIKKTQAATPGLTDQAKLPHKPQDTATTQQQQRPPHDVMSVIQPRQDNMTSATLCLDLNFAGAPQRSTPRAPQASPQFFETPLRHELTAPYFYPPYLL